MQILLYVQIIRKKKYINLYAFLETKEWLLTNFMTRKKINLNSKLII